MINLRKIFFISWHDLENKDQGTFLGFFWTLINPILFFATLFLIFNRLDNKPDNYPVFLLTGILFWNYFSNVTTSGIGIITSKYDYFFSGRTNLLELLLANNLHYLLILFFESTVCFFLLSFIAKVSLFNWINFLLGAILLIPLIIVVNYLLIWVRYFFLDTPRLWELALRVGFFITPIFYSPNQFNLSSYLRFNPLTYPLKVCREGVDTVNFTWLLYFLALTCLIVVFYNFTKNNFSKLVENC